MISPLEVLENLKPEMISTELDGIGALMGVHRNAKETDYQFKSRLRSLITKSTGEKQMQKIQANGNLFVEQNHEFNRDEAERELTNHFSNILHAMALSEGDQNLEETPHRLAKMWLEMCKGCYSPPPRLTSFENKSGKHELLIIKDITVKSLCAHHFVPFYGKAYIGVIPGTKLLGLSKYSRIVDWFARRPQIQEELNSQVADYIEKLLVDAEGVAVVMNCRHLCQQWRGVEDESAEFITSTMRGKFFDVATLRNEFMALISQHIYK